MQRDYELGEAVMRVVEQGGLRSDRQDLGDGLVHAGTDLGLGVG